MLWLGENYVKIWNVDVKERYADVRMSSGKKVGDAYVNSNWSFVRFVGTAFQKIDELEGNPRIKLTKSAITNESWEKEGVTQYPKTPKMVVFDFELLENNGGGGSSTSRKMDTAPSVADDTEEFPF